ncbi:Arm DNA-binding domain-containing protein [Nostoc sp. DSM 114160]|jgi:integrase
MKVGIEVSKGYLRLRFPRALFNGNQKYLSLNLADTVENRVAAEIQARRIELDILAGYFDPTLAKYKTDHTPTPKKQKVYSLLELWEKYTQFKSGQVQESTLRADL